MFYTIITNISFFLNVIFIIVLFRTFKDISLSELWQSAKNKLKSSIVLKNEIQKAEQKGEKPFYFANGTVVIYAKSQAGAAFKFKEMQKKEKRANKKTKKA